ncbi:MAG TPA: response regulator [Leptolyngbyaceae cyanobacterium M33_DOE_097]|uniref:histidine kinase n=1 Tax=Oscillatoriales cyanobacterium SpSt-418 TaxID=2282169 RepID=A0A7C3KGT8_9CYAN|nr:response regulator [Leptolyngbyaceae cyanobacterium M33_DOE_097]
MTQSREERVHSSCHPNSRQCFSQLNFVNPLNGYDGIELCRKIKANRLWCHIPIVMVTSLNSKEDLAKCLNAGANDFLTKPVSSQELCARVSSMLRIKQQYDDLQRLLQLREDMVSMIVHDLRNPLSSILLATELLRITNEVTESGQKKVDKIEVAAHQLQLQIDSLLFMAKLESGKMLLTLSEIDLCALCTSALEDFEAVAAQKSITLISQLPEPGGSVRVDANIFRRVLDNLLSNSIKFSPSKHKIVLQAHYLETGGAMIRVIDQGPGVSEELKRHIFEKYEIGTLMNGVSQTGLGLAFVKMAIETHGGTIDVENNKPSGTTFTLEIPG